MKVIFLDIDGVLNSTTSVIYYGKNASATKLCPVACALLKFLRKKTGAKIVISSTWRMVYGLEKTKKILKKHGITGVIGCTSFKLGYRDRSGEIKEWLDDNKRKKITHYVIIDDKEYGFKQSDTCKDSFVQTNYMAGLDVWNIAQAATILGHAEPILPVVLL